MITIVFDKVSREVIDSDEGVFEFKGMNPAYAVIYTEETKVEAWPHLIAARLSEMGDESVNALWEACRAYQQQYLTDDLSSMYWVERANSPKAQAIIDWKDSLWSEYYKRKASDVINLDFSQVGAPPWGYLDVRAELGL